MKHLNSQRHRLWCLCFAALLPLSAQAHVLEQLIASSLASHPAAQGQRALVQSAEAGVDSARWQFYPTPSVSIETANAGAADSLYQGDSRVSTMRLQQALWTGGRLSSGMDKACNWACAWCKPMATGCPPT